MNQEIKDRRHDKLRCDGAYKDELKTTRHTYSSFQLHYFEKILFLVSRSRQGLKNEASLSFVIIIELITVDELKSFVINFIDSQPMNIYSSASRHLS